MMATRGGDGGGQGGPIGDRDRDGRLHVVIPAYNEADTVRDVVLRTLRHAAHVIVVDDGSSDGTAARIEDLPIVLLRQARNGGKASALLRGFEWALGEGAAAVLTLDADGQHRPEEIPLFVEARHRRPDDIIVGSRLRNRADVPAIRYWANRFASFWVSWAAGVAIEDAQSGFRLYPSALLKDIRAGTGEYHGFTFESEFLVNAARAGHGISFVGVTASYPQDHMRETHYDHIGDNLRMIGMIAGKLIPRGMDPRALLRSLRSRRRH